MLPIIAVMAYISILWILFSLSRWDIRAYILPNKLNAALGVSFVVFHAATGWTYISYTECLLGALAGGGILLLIGMVASKYYGDDCLGLGDVKLMTAAGLGLGFPDIMLALSLGALLGMLHGVFIAFKEKRAGAQNVQLGRINVPAGAGLSGGIFIVMLWNFGFDWLPFLPVAG